MIIRYSISFDMRSFFPTEKDNRELSDLRNSIKAHFRKVFLFDNLINSHYDGISGLGNHVKSLFDMAYELKALGLHVSNEFMVNCLKSSMPENHTKHMLKMISFQRSANFASYQIDDKYKNGFERQIT